MHELMRLIDEAACELLDAGASDSELVGAMVDLMPAFKALIDHGYGLALEANRELYPGLYYYAVLLAGIAEGIADGSLKMPR